MNPNPPKTNRIHSNPQRLVKESEVYLWSKCWWYVGLGKTWLVHIEVSLLRIRWNVRYIDPLCIVSASAKSDRSGGELLPYLDFSYILVVFSYVDRFLDLWLNLTAWNSQKRIANYVATFAVVFWDLISRSKSVLVRSSPWKPVGSLAVLCFSWKNNIADNSDQFKSCLHYSADLFHPKKNRYNLCGGESIEESLLTSCWQCWQLVIGERFGILGVYSRRN